MKLKNLITPYTFLFFIFLFWVIGDIATTYIHAMQFGFEHELFPWLAWLLSNGQLLALVLPKLLGFAIIAYIVLDIEKNERWDNLTFFSACIFGISLSIAAFLNNVNVIMLGRV